MDRQVVSLREGDERVGDVREGDLQVGAAPADENLGVPRSCRNCPKTLSIIPSFPFDYLYKATFLLWVGVNIFNNF